MRLITSNQLTGFIFFIMIVFVAPVHAVVTYTMSVQKTGSGTVISTPAGINCGTKCDYSFKQNVKVTLKATPAKGYQFTGWGGDCSTSPCKVTINDSKNITATFTLLPRLSVQKFGNGTVTSSPAGINCGSKCDYLFKQNVKVALKATPAKGYEFVGWNDACSGGLCSVDIKNNSLVTATFRESISLKIGNPISIGDFSFAGGDGFTKAIHNYMYPIDIDNDGIEELICAGLQNYRISANFTPSQVSIFGWRLGKFVNITNQWLPNSTNIVDAVADIASGDFNGDGLIDVYLSGDADMTYQVSSYALINLGTSFKKVNLGLTEWEHGVASGDLNQDGYADVIVAGYIHPSPIYLGGPNGLTKTEVVDSYQNLSWDLNASGVAIGDFLGDGSKSLIVVDGASRNGGTNLFTIIKSGSNVSIDYVSSLPEPLMGEASHNVRARTIDFNQDALDDVMVFSRESWNGSRWPVNSRIQFYLNKGHGVFEDVTSTKLIGYDTHSNATYNPVFADFNRDGLMDIFVSEAAFDIESNSTAFLIKQPNGTFVDTYRKELSALVDPTGGVATLLRGPDNFYYIVSQYQSFGGGASLTMRKIQ